MDNDLDATLIRYNKFFEQLTDESVEEFSEFVSPNVRYRDPMMDAKGVDAALAYFSKMKSEALSLAQSGNGELLTPLHTPLPMNRDL